MKDVTDLKKKQPGVRLKFKDVDNSCFSRDSWHLFEPGFSDGASPNALDHTLTKVPGLLERFFWIFAECGQNPPELAEKKLR